MRLAAHAVLAVPLLSGMPLAAQTVQFSGAVATLAVQSGGFTKPYSVAVDQYGNVFVADPSSATVEEILAAGGYTAVNTVASGLTALQAIAVDRSGNLYITQEAAENEVSEILAVNGSIPANPLPIHLGGTFPFCDATGVAVDGSENVYIADECNDAVEEIPAAGGYTTATTLSIAFNRPWGVAVDPSGDVWVADADDGAVKEIQAVNGSIPANPAVITPPGGSGFRNPVAVSVDGSGNVYVVDQGYNAVFEILAASGYSTVDTLGAGWNIPSGVAASTSGEVFVADTYNNAVKEILAAANFGPVNVGSANANLVTLYFTFGASGALGSTAVLTQGAKGLDFTDAGSDTCTATPNQAYTTGQACGVNVTFKPEAPGPRYGAVELLGTSGNLLATGDLEGTGIGPLVNFLPYTLSQAVTNFAFSRPIAVAVDASGNLYVADAGNYEAYEFLAKSGYISFNQVGPGFLNPQGVAVDGGGNVYVTDGDTGAVYEILAVNGAFSANSTATTLASFTNPTGVAVDGSGNVYVADPTKGAVYEILAVNGAVPANPTVTTLASRELIQVAYPIGVAVDGSGNVFVADQNGAVYEILAVNGSVPANPTISAIGTNGPWESPWGVAVDGSGNVYVTDNQNAGVYEILAAGGYTTVPTLRQTANTPWGVAVDASRNVYYVTAEPPSGSPVSAAAVLKLDYADPPGLSFATTDVGLTSTDSPQTVTVENAGNANLLFPVPISGDNPSIGPDFTLNSSGQSDCPLLTSASANAATLAPAASCQLPISFTPAQAGPLTESLALTDNNLNAPSSSYAEQSIALSGTAVALSDFTLTNGGTITVSPGATTGNTSTITVTPLSGFNGTVNLSCSVTTIPTGATSPATCAVTPSVTISGTTAQNATLTVNTTSNTTPGAYAVTVTGMYVNPGSAGGITQMTTVDVTVTAPGSFSLSSNPNAFALTAGVNSGNTSSITVTPANGFTGAVNLSCSVTTFPAGATSPATCAVTPSVTISGTTAQNATLTVNTTSTTTPGAYAITVTGTAGSITQTTIVDVTVAAVSGTFTLGSSTDQVTVASGDNATVTLTLTPVGGFTGSVELTAALQGNTSGAPDLPTFSFFPNPVSVTGTSPVATTLTVSTTAESGALVHPNTRGNPWYAAGGATLACLLFFGIPARRRRWRTMLGMIALLAFLAAGLVSCGTPTSGSYIVTVTGTSGSITQEIELGVTVNR